MLGLQAVLTVRSTPGRLGGGREIPGVWLQGRGDHSRGVMMARVAHHTGAPCQALPDGGLAQPVRMPTAVEIFWATRIFGQETAAQRGPQPSIRGATVGPPWPPSTPPVWGARAGRPTGSSTAVDTPLPSPELGMCRLPPFPPLRGGAQRTRHLPMGCRCRGPAGEQWRQHARKWHTLA